MFSKQDVVKPRTAEDLERKYNFGETNRLIAESVQTIGETNKAVAAIRRTVSDNSAGLAFLTSWKDGTDESLSQIKQTATDQGASIDSLVSWKDETAESVASIEQRVTDNEAAIELLSKWDGEGGESLAQLVTRVDANEANITSITTWKDEATNSIASITQTVTDQGALIELKASKEEVEEQFGDYYTKEETDAELTVRDEEIATSVSKTYATIDALTGVEERVSSAETSITQNADAIALRATKTEVTEAKDAAIESANASTDGKLASYSTTAEMNAAIEISAGNITSSVESTYATKDELSGEVVSLTNSISTIEQTANENGAGIGLLVEYSADGTPTAKGEVLIEAINGESSAKISADRVDIEGKELNIKVAATNIVGSLTIGQIPNTVAQKSEIPTATSQLTNDSNFANASDIPTKTSDLTNDSDFATSSEIPTNMSQLVNDANIAYKSEILTKLSEMQNDIGLQDETGVTSIVGGMVTTDYVNALGVIAKGLSVKDLSALNATIGQWSIADNGLYADNNTVGLNGAPGNPIRIYAGLEKRAQNGAYITLDYYAYTSTTLEDGWIRYLNNDDYVEHSLVAFDGSPTNIIGVAPSEVRSRAASDEGNDAQKHSIRNVSYTYQPGDDGVVRILITSFETSTAISSSPVYMIFDTIYSVSAESANFRVHGNGDVDAERISSTSLGCGDLTIDGIGMARKVASSTDVTGTRTLTYRLSQDGKVVNVTETTGKAASTAHYLSVLYKINGTQMWTSVVVAAGSKGGGNFIPSNVDDTITDVTFGDGTTLTSVTENYSDTLASEYLDIPHAVKVERLKIGNLELTEDKLQRLLALL